MYKNWKILKTKLAEVEEEYSRVVEWCNSSKKYGIIDDGEFYKVEETPVYKTTYKDLRAAEYPPIEEQLDMIYWDKVNGTNNWEEKISEIKAKYPKVNLND